jgi:hypothetical protein
MNDYIEARKQLTEMGLLEEARDESGDIIYRDGEVVWKPVPYERLTEGQKAYLERMQSDEDIDLL